MDEAVKPLVWEGGTAESPVGSYGITSRSCSQPDCADDVYTLWFNGVVLLATHHGENSAKLQSAAQADYAARITAALDPAWLARQAQLETDFANTIAANAALVARIAALDRGGSDLTEMTRRRDEWKAKADGYDKVRLALRDAIAGKFGEDDPRTMSRVIWAGVAADHKKRADDLQAALDRAEAKGGELSGRVDALTERVLELVATLDAADAEKARVTEWADAREACLHIARDVARADELSKAIDRLSKAEWALFSAIRRGAKP